jgi:GT2 family glycosyltransferase
MARGRPPSLEELDLVAPRVRFPITICALFFGDHTELCRRLLDSLYSNTDPAAFELRCGLNAAVSETRKLVTSARRRRGNVRVCESRRNIRKCPMMRRLFHQRRIDTEWTLWFDDDSFVSRPDWLLSWALAVESRPDADVFGSIRFVTASPRIQRFIESASWYRGKPLATNPATGEPWLEFVVGGFWAVRSRLIYEIDWPDPRLIHFEDDYIFGEALRQRDAVTAPFDSGVVIDDAPRRGPPDGPSLDFPM